MIVAVDHIVLVCSDLAAAIDDYQLLLGQQPVWASQSDEMSSAFFRFDNTALELIAPRGTGPLADRIQRVIDRARGPSLASLAFVSDAIDDDHHRLGRRQLGPSEIEARSSIDQTTGMQRSWQRFRLDEDSLAGIKTFVIKNESDLPARQATNETQVHSLDHLVVTTSYPERAVATFGGRLGLNLALDRTESKWGVRFLFFRTGGLTLEFVQKLSETKASQDRLWGLTWAVIDLPGAKARLDQAGVTTTEIRPGRKPGSQVFTVKSHTQEVPTLFIAHVPQAE